jgi:hypothetical protein
LFFKRQVNKFPAFFTAASSNLDAHSAHWNEQKMTTIVGAVYMGIGWFSALMAKGNDLVSYPFSQAVIKYKILATKFIC